MKFICVGVIIGSLSVLANASTDLSTIKNARQQVEISGVSINHQTGRTGVSVPLPTGHCSATNSSVGTGVSCATENFSISQNHITFKIFGQEINLTK